LLATNQWCPMPTTNAGNFTFNPGGGESVVIDQRTGEFLVFGDVPVGKGANVYGAYYFGPGAEQGEIWWSGLPVPNPASRWSQRVAPDPSGASPRYTGLPAAAPFFWLEGRGFDGTIVASFPFHHQLFTVAFPPGNLSRADLRCWSPDARVPVEFPVSLPKRTFYGMPDTRVIIADDCVFVWSPQIPMTWCIDGKELLSRLENLSRNRNSEINTNSGTIQAVSP
jgi:hypothetical protein